MAASLISRHPDGRLLGITAGIDANHVVISVRQDGVHVYGTHDAKLERSYPLGSNKGTLLSPVIADPDSSSYFAALRDVSKNMDYLVTWEASAANVPPLSEISPRIPVDGRIEGLYLLQQADSSSAVVVLANGSVAVPRWNDFTLQFLSNKPAKSAFVYASASSDTLLVVSQVGQSDPVLETFTLTAQGVTKSAQLPLPSQPAPARILTAACASSTVACLWSTGTLKLFRRPSPNTPHKEALTYALNPALLAAPATPSSATTPTSGKKRKAPPAAAASPPADPHSAPPLALLPLDDSRILVAGSSKSPSQLTISVLDTTYGCTLSESTLPLPTPPAGPAPHPLTLTAAHGSIILSAAGHVYHLTLTAPPATLASMLGKLSMLTPTPPHPPVLSAHDLASRCVPPTATHPAVPPSVPLTLHRHTAPPAGGAPFPLPLVPTDPASPPGPTATPSGVHLHPPATPPSDPHAAKRAKHQQHLDGQAAAVLAEMLQQQRAPTHPTPNTPTPSTSNPSTPTAVPPAKFLKLLDRACNLLSECATHGTRLTSQLPELVAVHLAAAGRWRQLELLLETHPLRTLHGGSAHILEQLVAAHQYPLVARLCAGLREVPPRAVAACLRLVLARDPAAAAGAATAAAAAQAARGQWRQQVRAEAASLVAAAEDVPSDTTRLEPARWAAAVVDGFSAREVCLHALVALPLDPMEMAAAARQLPGAEAQRLLRYLAKWARAHERLGFGGAGGYGGDEGVLAGPGARQVVEWVTRVLDAHLALMVVQGGRAAGALRGVRGVVQRQLGGAMQLLRVRGTAEHMLGGGKLPAAAVTRATSYTIELLDLTVR